MTDGSSQAPDNGASDGGKPGDQASDMESTRSRVTRVVHDAAHDRQVQQAPMGFTIVGFFVGVTRRTRFTRSKLREVSTVLDVLRAPLFVSLLGSIIFAFPGQIYEIYRLMAEDFSFAKGFTAGNLRFVSFFVMLYIAGYAIWYVARVLTLTNETIQKCLLEVDIDSLVARWAPRVLGALPAFAAAFGMARAEWLRDGQIKTEGLYGAAAIAFLIGALRLWSSFRRTRHDPQLYENLRQSWLRVDVRLLMTLLLLGAVGYMLTQPIGLTQWAGVLSIVSFFMIALVFAAAQLTYVYDRYAVPVLTALIVSVFVWSSLDWNDNHFIRTLDPVEPQMVRASTATARVQTAGAEGDDTAEADDRVLMNVEQAFDAWYRSRADRAAYEAANKPYPVYIIAAQGGGLYAAYQTSMFLAMIQDSCPNFAQHVFAISGVSGGAVGASIFAGQVLESGQNGPVNDASPCGASPTGYGTNLVDQADGILRDDFLSPVVSGLLFGDFTARFSPVPLPSFDRSRALEAAFERSWRRAERRVEEQAESTAKVQGRSAPVQLDEADTNPLTSGLLTYWTPLGAAPALFYNTSAVETGERMILSPIPDLGASLQSYAKLAQRDSQGRVADVRLSTAMVLSARFPYITPAGSVALQQSKDGSGARKLRLVDGGYFENSGIETAFDVMNELGQRLKNRRRPQRITADSGDAAVNSARAQRLERLERVRRRQRINVDFRMIVFDLTEDRFREPSYALGELLSPVKAILNSRASRAQLAQDRARRQLDSPCRYILFGGQQWRTEGDEYSVSQACPLSEVRNDQVWSVSLNDYEYDFQLGWLLSQDTLARIRRQLGDAADCQRAAPTATDDATLDELYAATGAEQREADDLVRRHNSCVASFIIDQLKREN